MSYLHITKNGVQSHYQINDGKSDLLDRYVNLDTGRMYYTLGKQIAGKAIDPDGKTGREIMRIVRELGLL